MVIFLFTVRQWLLHRWIVAYVILLTATSLFIFYVAFLGLLFVQPEYYGRVAVASINASIFLISLLSLLLGSFIFHDDRDTGLLEWFLSRPVSARGYLVQRWGGVVVSVAAATIVAFIIAYLASGLLFGIFFSQLIYLGLWLAVLVASLSSLGGVIALFLPDKTTSITAGFLIWLVLNIVWGIVVFALGIGLSETELYITYILNPVEATRFMALYTIDPNLSFMNPITAASLLLSLGALTYVLPVATLTAPIAVFLTLAHVKYTNLLKKI
ncbi:ABC transporter permease subunit [Pyrobaculum sp.]|uniref:ABC transporter permease subunit n=1 Tax=Pyrobaculum sp. TaxID=2004705 RepID=UPI0031608464